MKGNVLCLVVCQVLKRMMATCSDICEGCVLAAKAAKQSVKSFMGFFFCIILILEVNIYSRFSVVAVNHFVFLHPTWVFLFCVLVLCRKNDRL